MQVFLIRHPPPLIEAGVCYGRLDLDCADPALYAAALQAQLPAGTVVFSSPLRRAHRLAEALAQTLATEVRLDERLREIDFGAWEGCRWDDIARAEIDAWAADVLGYAPPGGESVAALQARAVDFAASLASSRAASLASSRAASLASSRAGSVAIVSHAGVLRALIGHWRALPTREWTQLAFAYGGLSTFDLAFPSPR